MSKIDSPRASKSVASKSPLWAEVFSVLCRFGLAGVWLYTGALKMMDPMGFRQSVEAYRLFPVNVVSLIAQTLPPVEISLGLLLLLGLFLRYAGAVTAVIMIGFILGISSAWVRGLQINCGCFSTSDHAEPTSYGFAIARDLLFLFMALWTVWRPFTKLSLHP